MTTMMAELVKMTDRKTERSSRGCGLFGETPLGTAGDCGRLGETPLGTTDGGGRRADRMKSQRDSKVVAEAATSLIMPPFEMPEIATWMEMINTANEA